MTTSRLAGLALLAAPALAPGLAQAQTALEPGHPDLAHPPAQSYEYEIRTTGETPRRLGTVTRTETVSGDRLVLTTHTVMPARQLDRADTTVVSWPGLAPIARAFHDGEETVRLTFANGRLGGRSVLGNLDEAVDAAFPAGAFAEGMDSRIARSVPLRAGYTATFHSADKFGDAPTSTVTVGDEAGGAYPVTVATPGHPATTFDVDAATRAIRRVSYSPRPDMTIEYAPAAALVGAVLRPGDAAFNTAWLGDETVHYALMLVQPMQMPVGTSTVTRTVAGGVATSTTEIDVPSQSMHQSVTSRATAATLAPLGQTMAGGQMTAELAFTPAGVTGTRTPHGEAEAPVSAAFDAPVFDAGWAAVLAASLPFSEGYSATVQAYDIQNGVSPLTFTVKGRQELDGVPVWEVEAVSASGPVTYYIDPATHRVAKMRMSPQEGVVVEMIRQP